MHDNIADRTKRKHIYKHPLLNGPHCYTVHADRYLKIEKPKKHVAKGRLFPKMTAPLTWLNK